MYYVFTIIVGLISLHMVWSAKKIFPIKEVLYATIAVSFAIVADAILSAIILTN